MMSKKPKRMGMVIDQNRCVGCWSCSVGCKAINNEPMGVAWNRVLTTAPGDAQGRPAPASESIDVPSGKFPNLELAYVPVACQHCTNAPCVKVCPVGATFRRDDGAVLIDYERCIGCRYCVAACPYGVRIFNWGAKQESNQFVTGYGKDYRSDGRLVFSPERPIGVVEKCTFCVERVDAGQEPFCIAICPTGARVFGDLDDPGSEVSDLVNQGGAVQLLEDLGTQPNVFYIPVQKKRDEEL